MKSMKNPSRPTHLQLGSTARLGRQRAASTSVEALTQLANTGVEFSFVSMSCGQPGTLARYYQKILDNSTLKKRTWILPPIAPWRIPAFLARCDAVAFLERGFSIKFHGPMIPLEVLSSGACLICSNEIAAKRFYQGNLINDRNAFVVADPTITESWRASCSRQFRIPFARSPSERRAANYTDFFPINS